MKVLEEHRQFAESIIEDLQQIDADQKQNVWGRIQNLMRSYFRNETLYDSEFGVYADEVWDSLATQCEGNQDRMKRFWHVVTNEVDNQLTWKSQ